MVGGPALGEVASVARPGREGGGEALPPLCGSQASGHSSGFHI